MENITTLLFDSEEVDLHDCKKKNSSFFLVYLNFILNRVFCVVSASTVCRVAVLVAGNQARF